MKKNLLLLSFGFSLFGFSQSSLHLATLNNLKTATITALPNGASFNESTAAGLTTVAKIRIYNVSASTHTYNVRRYDEVLNSGAAAYFCVGSNCLPPSSTSLTAPGDYIVIAPANFENNFTIDIDEAPSVGMSRVRYKVFNVNSPNDTLSFKINYNGAVGLTEMGQRFEDATIYPNPVSDKAILRYNSNTSEAITVSITNSVGQVIAKYGLRSEIGLNNMPLYTNGCSSGIYYVTLSGNDSKMTRKIIIE
jgi:hypothetical protein